MGPPSSSQTVLDLFFRDGMNRHYFDIVWKLIVRDHHQGTMATVKHFHHSTVAQGMMVEIPLLAFTIDPLGQFLGDFPHANLEPQVIAMPDLHIALNA
jgi:hypothetical protein